MKSHTLQRCHSSSIVIRPWQRSSIELSLPGLPPYYCRRQFLAMMRDAFALQLLRAAEREEQLGRGFEDSTSRFNAPVQDFGWTRLCLADLSKTSSAMSKRQMLECASLMTYGKSLFLVSVSLPQRRKGAK